MWRIFSLICFISLLIGGSVLGLWISGKDIAEPSEVLPWWDLRERLAQQDTEITFDGVELRDAIGSLRDPISDFGNTGGLVNIYAPLHPPKPPCDLDVDWKAIEAAGINTHARVTYNRKLVSSGVALADFTRGTGIVCRADARLVHISTPAGLKTVGSIFREPLIYLPADRKAASLLERPVTIEGATSGRWLRNVLASIIDASGVDIHCDWMQLQKAGVTSITTINEEDRTLAASDLLALVLRDAARHGELQYEIRHGVVFISSRAAFERRGIQASTVFAIIVGVVLLGFIFAGVSIRRKMRKTEWHLPRGIALTIALLLATGAGLVASLLPVDGVTFNCASQKFVLTRGGSIVQFMVMPSDSMRPYIEPRRSAPSTHERLGITWTQSGWPLELNVIQAKCSVFAIAAGMFPLFWFVLVSYSAWRAHRRRRSGRCLSCGYDLRGSTTARCPECGNLAAASPPAIIRAC